MVCHKLIESMVLEWKMLGNIHRQHLPAWRQNHCKPGWYRTGIISNHILNIFETLSMLKNRKLCKRRPVYKVQGIPVRSTGTEESLLLLVASKKQ